MHGNEAAEEAGKNYKMYGILNNFCSARTDYLTPLSLIRIAIGLKKLTKSLLARFQHVFLFSQPELTLF